MDKSEGRKAAGARGFTLLELMIAGGIVAILATIALPSYSRYVLRSNRTTAKRELVDLAAKQDIRKLQRRSFSSDFSDLVSIGGNTLYVNRSGTLSSTSAGDSIYKITLSSDKATSTSCGVSPATGGYALTAVAVDGVQSRDSGCSSLCLSSSGLRGAAPGSIAVCWGQ